MNVALSVRSLKVELLWMLPSRLRVWVGVPPPFWREVS